MCAACAMLASYLKSSSGVTRNRSVRPSFARRWPATDARPSMVCFLSCSDPRMLTCPLPWRRSRVTSTPVTVTRPVTRGSSTPSARTMPTAPRFASAPRWGRRFQPAERLAEVATDHPVRAEQAHKAESGYGGALERPVQPSAEVVGLSVETGRPFRLAVRVQVRLRVLRKREVMLEMVLLDLGCPRVAFEPLAREVVDGFQHHEPRFLPGAAATYQQLLVDQALQDVQVGARNLLGCLDRGAIGEHGKRRECVGLR